MALTQRFLVGITLVNAALAAVSLVPVVNAAAPSDVAPVVRTQRLEIVDGSNRVRASIIVHAAQGKEEETVVLRLVNADGRPGVKIASAHTMAGAAFINSQGNHAQIAGDGMKVTRSHGLVAQLP